MSLKHFIIAGAQRSGTTFLYSLLDQHPQIQMAKPMRPEPKFFLQPLTADAGQEYLQRYFTATTEEIRWLGEKSTSYIESADAAGRINALLPQSKVIFVLRNPLLRAISNVRFSQVNGYEQRTVTEALSAALQNDTVALDDTVSVSPWNYLGRGRYAEFLSPYLDIFGRQRVHLVNSEGLFQNFTVIQELCDWLKIDSQVQFDAQVAEYNASSKPSGLSQLPGALVQDLQEYYRQSNLALADTWGFDISGW